MPTPKNRALTETQKREVLDRILAVWLRNPDLRLGQMLHCASPPDGDTFYTEDFTLCERLESDWPGSRK